MLLGFSLKKLKMILQIPLTRFEDQSSLTVLDSQGPSGTFSSSAGRPLRVSQKHWFHKIVVYTESWRDE